MWGESLDSIDHREQRDLLLRGSGFLCASTSILALLLHMYGVVSMSIFMVYGFLPGMGMLAFLSLLARSYDRFLFWHRLVTGLWTGFLATIVYDVYRVPYVLMGMPIFNVFSVFGSMITGQPPDTSVSDVVGWAYHFSNGVTIGIMYALVAGRAWWFYAVIWGLLLETAMVSSPYPLAFGIPVDFAFVTVSMTAHIAYGTALGLLIRRYMKQTPHEIMRMVNRFQADLRKGRAISRSSSRFIASLKFRDDEGRSWTLDSNSCVWQYLEGGQWKQGDPPKLLRRA